ncbi:MAG: redoxin domain-containing protein [Planctomycetota bacterium]|nr:redoxin domain-containing protein [Planctomycetota bacterium]
MLPTGSTCPSFRAFDTEGRAVTDVDLRGKRAVLWFFPKADTPG